MGKTEESSVLTAIMEQYEKNKTQSYLNKSDFDMTKYFACKLQKGEKTAEKRFRFLPGKDGETPFTEVYWHEIQVDGNWRKIYCHKHNDGERCPLCEVEEALKLTGSAEDKKLSYQYRSRKWYVVKGIDRDNEEEGVKFWRFRHNAKGNGVMDKLMPIFAKKGDITHPREGRDVTIMIGRDDRGYSVVNAVMAEDVGILTNDAKKAKEWIGNQETYKDVYSSQAVEYIEIVARGEKPVWNKEAKMWTSESEINEPSNQNKGQTKKQVSKDDNGDDEYTVENESSDDESDDLPF